jgi:hypothetical protein
MIPGVSLHTSQCLVAVAMTLAGMCVVYANEPPYTPSTAQAYLESKPNVAVVLRVDGGVSPGEFVGLAGELGSDKDTNQILSRWKKDVDVYPEHRLVILRALKGSLTGHLMVRSTVPEIYLIPLGRPVLVFLDTNVEEISTCDVFDVEQFPRALLVAGSLPEIVNAIVEKRLSPCMRQKD